MALQNSISDASTRISNAERDIVSNSLAIDEATIIASPINLNILEELMHYPLLKYFSFSPSKILSVLLFQNITCIKSCISCWKTWEDTATVGGALRSLKRAATRTTTLTRFLLFQRLSGGLMVSAIFTFLTARHCSLQFLLNDQTDHPKEEWRSKKFHWMV